ncbi:MAG: hypothetical protein ACYC2T_12755 [Bacillota bacterium]
MSMNRIIRQGLDLAQGLAALPFETIQRGWREDDTAASQSVKRMAAFAEGLVTLPFKAARDFFEEDPPIQTNQNQQSSNSSGQVNQEHQNSNPSNQVNQQPQGYMGGP